MKWILRPNDVVLTRTMILISKRGMPRVKARKQLPRMMSKSTSPSWQHHKLDLHVVRLCQRDLHCKQDVSRNSISRRLRDNILIRSITLAGNFHRANIPMPAMISPTSYYPHCLACNNSHGSHPPGYCPLKLVGNEHCNLCGLAHFGIPGICPHLGNELACRTMLRQLKDSSEAPALKEASAKHLRDIISRLVQKDREKKPQPGRTGQSRTTSGAPGSSVAPHVPLAAGNDPSMRVPHVLGPPLGNNAFGYSASLQGLVPPVPRPSQPPTMPQPRMPATASYPRSNVLHMNGQPGMPPNISYSRHPNTNIQPNGK